MKKGRGALKAIVGELARSSERSSLFWWMVEHHDALAGASGGRRIRWQPLCQKFAALGLTDGTGKPANEKTAGETWLRARTEVARQRKDRAKAEAEMFPTLRPIPTQHARQQDRAPRVEPAAAPPVVEPPRPFTRQQPLPSNETQTSADEVPEDVRAKLEAVTRQLYGEDRWLGPPPKRKLNGQA